MAATGEKEDYIVRIPKHIRYINDLVLGTHLVFNTKDKRKIAFEIKKAFHSDLIEDGNSCFISDRVINNLDLRDVTHTGAILNPIEITLGCDPEFFLTTQDNQIVNAGNLFNKYGVIGHDGVLCEIRPGPSIDPGAVTETIRSLLHKVRQVIPAEYKMIASSYFNDISAGFHVHLGLPPPYLNHKFNSYIFKYITRVLDFYVATLAVLTEINEESGRRSSIGIKYGKIGDFRSNLRTLEYRVPGGIMLKTPTLTRGLLSLCKLVSMDALNRLLIQTDNLKNTSTIINLDVATHEVYPNILTESLLKKFINSKDLTSVLSLFDLITEDIRKMYAFENYSNILELLFKEVKNKNIINDLSINWLQ